MSTTIDERVLEMRFDNRQFENGVSSTMSTLDKLKQKLNFTGASKGLENVNAAAKNVNMTGLGSAVETVTAKFSAMQVMGVTALANITNSAVNAGKRIVSALTIDPVRTGLSEYETKMNAIQVIKANTRSKYDNELDQMNAITSALEDLNKYADRTIYNFTQMTDNVGKFVAQGLDVDEAAKAVQGLANLAGASGASAQDMARATYQMSQALGGVIRKIDWNSLRNANMATVELKSTLMDIARVRGINIDEMIESKGTFEDTLEKGWLTGEIFTEAMNIYSDVYSEAELKAKGFTEDQVKNFKELARMAQEATVEVKTFSQLWDVLKETAQSGWTQTWELVFGDFNTSKRLFTDMQIYFSDIINGWSNARNTLLGNALNPAEKLESIFVKLGKSTDKDIIGLGEIEKKIKSVTDLTDKLEYYQAVVNKVWRGDYGKAATGRYELLEKEGYNSRVVQDLVNKGYKYKLTIEDIEESHKKYGVTVDAVSKTAEESTAAIEWTINATEDLSDATLKSIGLTEDEIRLYRELQKESKRTGRSIEDLTKAMSEKGGRELLIESVKNAWAGLVNIIKAVKDAWYDVFSPISSVRLYTMIESIEKFSRYLRDNEKVAEKVGRTFRGVFAALDLAISVLSGPLKFLVKIVGGVLKSLGLSFLDITATIGDGIVAVRDGINGVVGSISGFIADHVSKWIDKIKETEIFKSVGEWFKETKDSIVESVDKISERFEEFNTTRFMDSIRAVGGFLTSVGSKLASSDTFIFIVDSVCAAFGKLRDFFSRFKIPKFSLDNTTFFTSILEKFDGVTDVNGLINTFGSWLKGRAMTKAKAKFKEVFEMDWATFKAVSLEKFAAFWIATGDKMKAGLEKCKEVLKIVAEFIFGTENINLPAILDLAEKFLGIAVLFKALKLLDTLASPFDNITDAIDNLASKLKWQAVGSAFKAMALVLIALTACIVILANMPDMSRAWEATKMLGVMLGAMAVVIAGLMFMASKLPSEDTLDIVGVSLSILALVGAIYLLTEVLQAIDGMKLQDPGRTFISLGIMLAGLAAGVKIIAAAGSSSFKSVAAILTLVSALKLILGVIDSYDQFDWTGKADAIARMAGMLIILSAAINIASRGMKGDAGASGLAMLLLAMVFSLKILLGVMEDFASMDAGTLLKGGAAIAALLTAMTIMMVAVGKTNEGKVLEKGQKSVNNFVGLATALLAVVAAVWLLGKMATKDFDTFISGGLAVTAILAMFTVMVSAIGKSCSGLKMGSVIIALVGMGLLIAEVAIILNKMAEIPWQQSVGTAGALATVLIAITAVLKILNNTKIDALNVTQWIGAMAGLMLVIGTIAIMIGYLTNNIQDADSAIKVAAAIGILMGALTISLKMIAGLHTVSLGAIGAMAGLVLILAGLAGVFGILKAFDVEPSIETATSLSVLLLTMAGVTAICSTFGAVALSAVAGVAALAGAILIVGALIMGIGALVEKVPAAETFLDSGIPVLEKIGVGFGKLIGGFIGGIGEGVMDSFSNMVDTFGEIIDKLVEISNTGTNINTDGFDGVSKVLKAISSIALTGVGTSIADLFTGIFSGKSSIEKFEKDCVAFFGALEAIGEATSGIQIDSQTFDEIMAAATQLVDLQSSLEPIGGVVDWFTGRDDLATFGINMGFFLNAMKIALSNLHGFQFDNQTFDEIVKAATSLSTLQSSLEPIGGVVSWFSGRDDLGKFGGNVGLFINSMKYALSNVYGFQFDKQTFDEILNAATSLSTLQSSLEPIGGVVSWFSGRDDLATFGINMGFFLNAMKIALSNLHGFQVDNQTFGEVLATAVALAGLQSQLEPMGGVISWFNGRDDLGKFGENIALFADGMGKLATGMGENGITDAVITSITNAGTAIIELEKALPTEKLFDGKMDLSSFSFYIMDFATAMSTFSTTAAGIDSTSVDVAMSAANKIKTLISGLVDLDTSGLKAFTGIGTGGFGADGAAYKVAKAISSFSNEVSDMDTSKVSTAATTAIRIKNLISDLSGIDTSGVTSFKTAVSELATVDIGTLAENFSEVTSDFSDIGSDIIESLADGMHGKIDSIKVILDEIASTLEDAMTAIKNCVSKGASSIRGYYTAFYNAGSYLVDGFAAGISVNSYKAEAKAAAMAEAAEQAAREALGINSPSKVFREIGMGIPEGFIQGIEKLGGSVDKAVIGMGDTAIDSVGYTISKIASAINMDIDSQPTIRPVLDLSDVRSGAASIGNLFDANAQVGVMANVGVVSSMMHGYGQNGGNIDVVSAIDKLRKDLGNVRGDSYQINGVTYDDGSNIADAVRTIARAAIMERRM